MHYFHALDYLNYAYLQRGEDNKAGQVLADMRNLVGPFQLTPPTAYALAAAESRPALERQDWKRAAALKPMRSADVAWDKFPEYEALTHFAAGLGAARTGSTGIAKKAVTRLGELQGQIKDPYWIGQIEIQKNIVNAWLAFGNGSKKVAVDLLTAAAEQEWATQKHPITPGELLPARELLGDLLLELDRPQDALVHYEMSLQRSPQRLNTLYGAGLSAEMSNEVAKATMYYAEFIQLTADADSTLTGKRQKAEEYLKKPAS